MTMAWRIVDWSDRYERCDTRRAKVMLWLATSTDLGERSYLRIMQHPQGAAIYGAGIMIAAVAAGMPTRGLLVDRTGPLDADDLSMMTRAPLELIETALEVLSRPEIAWIERVTRDDGDDDPDGTRSPSGCDSGDTRPQQQTDTDDTICSGDQEIHPHPDGIRMASGCDPGDIRTTRPDQTRPDRTPPPPQTPPAADDDRWGKAVERLSRSGVAKARQAVSRARDIGATPEDVCRIIDWYEMQPPGAYGAGALHDRIAYMAPGTPADQGWPPPPPDVQREQQRAADSERRRRDRTAQETAEAQRQQAAEAGQQEREASHGPALDSLSDDELRALIARLPEPEQRTMRRETPTQWREHPRYRGRLLWILASQQQEGAA